MLYALVGNFILYFILVSIFHIKVSFQADLAQGILASVRSLVYHGSLGSICFIHAQRSIWITAAGIQLQNEISGQFPPDGWKRLKGYETMMQNYNNYSGNVVSIALLFYFAAAASSCLSLGMDDGGDRILLVILIICPATIICLTTLFSAGVSKQGKQTIRPLYFSLPKMRFQLDLLELESEIGGFVVSTTQFLRFLIGLGTFVFTFIPVASWVNRLDR